MNLTLSEEQKLIKDSARKYLELNYSFDKRQKLIVENPLDYPFQKTSEVSEVMLIIL